MDARPPDAVPWAFTWGNFRDDESMGVFSERLKAIVGFKEWHKKDEEKMEVVFESKVSSQLGTTLLSSIPLLKRDGEGYVPGVISAVYEYKPPPPVVIVEKEMEVDGPEDATEGPVHKKARRAEDESRFQAIEKEQRAQGQQLTALNDKIEENKKAVDGVREQVTTLAERQHVATMQSGANWHNLGVLDKKARHVLKGYMKKRDTGVHCFVVYADEETERYVTTECVITEVDGPDITWESSTEPLAGEDPEEATCTKEWFFQEAGAASERAGALNNILEHHEKLIEKAGGPAPMDA